MTNIGKWLLRAVLAAYVIYTGAGAIAKADDIRPFVRGSWREIVAAGAGKPAIFHFWGLTCAPCLVELPQWGALRREIPDVRLVMIGADPAPANADGLTAQLKKAGLSDVESWAFADSFAERLRYEINPKWRGEMPYTVLVGRNGSVTAMTGIADLRAVRNWFKSESK